MWYNILSSSITTTERNVVGSQTATLQIFSSAYDTLAPVLKSDTRLYAHAMFQCLKALEWVFHQEGRRRPVVGVEITARQTLLVCDIIEAEFSKARAEVPTNVQIRIEDLRKQSMGAEAHSSVA